MQQTPTTTIIYLASNFWALFVLFVFLLVIFHLLLVRGFKLTKVAWKYVDYIWLTVAAFGLLSASSESRRLLATNHLNDQKSYTSAAYNRFHSQLQFNAGPAICREFVRSQNSPANFDEIQKEFNLVCEYS